jgi:Glycosyl transferase family 2
MPLATESLPTFSVVVEWENARWADLARTRQMLAALRTQLAELRPRLAGPPPIIFVYDRLRIDSQVIDRCLKDSFATIDGLCTLRLLPVEDMGYYQLKNAGAAAASGEVLILLDCDVIPDPGWLEAMLTPFLDGKIEVVTGQTYVGPYTLYEKSAALFWVFPLRRNESGLVKVKHAFANNCAFRRELFLRHPYPEAKMYRGNCRLLSRELFARGVDIHQQLAARVDHPPPAGLGQFFVRGIWRGHDDLLLADRLQRQSFPQVIGAATKRLRESDRRIVTQHSTVGLGAGGAAIAYLLGLAYNLLAAGGAIMARLAPRTLHRWVPK